MKSTALANLKEEVKRYLTSSEAEVLAIRGKWGIGKTFTWKKLLNENKNNVAFNKYSYVSLFGINDLSSLEVAIFRSTINKSNIGKEPSIDTFKQNIYSLFSGNNFKKAGKTISFGIWESIKSTLHYFANIPIIKSFSGFMDSISFFAIKDVVICVDDFERRGNGLALRDVLGLVSMLKEQRNCKVVLIFNENELKDDKDDYGKFREKVIDIEISFTLTPDDCIDLVFLDKDPLKPYMKDFFERLGVNNIRIAKKIERLARVLHTNLSDFEPEVLSNALHSLVLFSWSFYSREHVPGFSFLKKYNFMNPVNQSNEENKENGWNKILREYEYFNTDSFDLMIADGIEQGYFNINMLKQKANKLNNKLQSGKSEKSFFHAWEVFHNSLANNPEEVISALKRGFYQSYLYITPLNLSTTTCLLKELGEEKIANEMIDYYIEQRKTEKGLFSLEEDTRYQCIKDKTIIEKFKKIADAQKVSKSLKELLIGVNDLSSWSKQDEELLVNTTEKEFFDLFKSIKGNDLSKIITTGLSFGKINNPTENYKKIDQSVRKALVKIGKESTLNAKRISNYGIQI